MSPPARPNYLLLAALLLLAQGALFLLRDRGQARAAPVETSRVPLTIGEWRCREARPLDQATLTMLQPDAYLQRIYDRPDRASVLLTVIYGHRKSSFHSPGFCLQGAGWTILRKGVLAVPAAPTQGPPVRAHPPWRINRFLLQKGDDRAVVLYYYLHRHQAVTSWTGLQGRLLYDRLRGGPGAGALVSLSMLAQGQGENADRIGLAFLAEVHPAVLRSMSTDRGGR